MEVISIGLDDRSYDIEISQNSLSRIGVALASLGDVSRVVLITDDNVESLYAEKVSESIMERGIDVDVAVIPAGEESKSVETVYALWEQFLEIKIDRRSVVVALGGGVVGDISGFVAATYARGIRYFQAPTSLLAQVDSSVGGKTAINLPNAKNMVGAFHQPCGVLIDPVVLKTLPDDQYRSGLGEVVKYGCSLDAFFFNLLERNVLTINERSPNILAEIIARCCRIKAKVVSQDERETTGFRALLNYGHTFGHALEAAIGYGKILHGHGVALGSALSAKLALRLSQKGDERFRNINDSLVIRQNQLIAAFGLPNSLSDLADSAGDEVDLSPKRLLELMTSDKKCEFGKLKFVLPTGLGQCSLVSDVPIDDVLAILE